MKHPAKRFVSAALGVALLVGSTAPAFAGDAQVSPKMTTSAPINAFANNSAALGLSQIARYSAGAFHTDGGVMEIVAYNTATKFAYAINGQSGKLAVISLADLKASNNVASLAGKDIDIKALVEKNDKTFHYGDMTSVAISPDNSTLAAALQAKGYNDPGRVALFTCGTDGKLTFKGLVTVGVQPDMVTFADNNTVLTADEGEPRKGYGEGIADPKGSVSVVSVADLKGDVIGFDAFDAKRADLVENGVILKKNTAPSVDLEPEYITVNGGKAYVTLQEANAIAVLDIGAKTFDGVYGLGFEKYGKTPVDIDKKDDAYAPKTYDSLYGIRMPDGLAAFNANGKTYLITANEGDGREWGDEKSGSGYSNEDSRNFKKDDTTSPSGAITAENSGLKGKVLFFDTTDYDGLDASKDYLFGGRSFTIFEAGDNGLKEVFTSGADLEALSAKYLPDYFNCSNDNTTLDNRSGKKGPEPESVVIGHVDGHTYAFVALERIGGIMVYDVSDPANAHFVNYINSRDFSTIVKGSEKYEDGELDKWVSGGDVSPEGLAFISADNSPTKSPLLLAACEVSGTVAVYNLASDKTSAGNNNFHDVATDAWYADAVRYVNENGLMTGTAPGTFAPEAKTTRAMIATILWRLEGSPAASAATFRDIDGHYAADAIAWAAANHIVNGYSADAFGPDDAITREQLGAMLANYAAYKKIGSETNPSVLDAFNDKATLSKYAVDTMAWAVGNGLIAGIDSHTLAPQGTATRAQTAAILQRLIALSA